MAAVWKPLSTLEDLPPLLIATSFGSRAYTVSITDLTNIWTESLDLRSIKKRSLDESTTIDPTEGEDQLQKFLEKIQLGAEGGENTTSSLTINVDAGRPTIILNISVELKGFDPLKWPFYLALCDPVMLTSQLLVPLLRAQHTSTAETTGLTKVVKEKDYVIQKLLDRIEAQGMDLGQIFPQAAAKGARKTDRAKAAEKVKALGAFNIEAWRAELHTEEAEDMKVLVEQVFTREIKVHAGANVPLGAKDWWDSVQGDIITLSTGRSETLEESESQWPRPVPGSSPNVGISREDDDDDFQVQSTPPHVPSSPVKHVAPRRKIEESTDDEDDLDAPSQRSKIPDSFPSSPPRVISPVKSKKLGSIGGAKKQVPRRPLAYEDTTGDDEPISPPMRKHVGAKSSTPGSSSPPKMKGSLGKLSGKKPPPSPNVSAPPPKEQSPSPDELKATKGKLGKLGGKRKAVTPPPPPADDDSSETEDDLPKRPVMKRKLGRIGGTKTTPTKAAIPRPVEKIEEIKKEDTPEEERADKRRMQLKKDLDAMAKAPVKKKRKF